MNGWTDGLMDGCAGGCMDDRGWVVRWLMGGWMHGWMHGWMDGCMHRWMDGREDGLFAGSVVREPQVQTLSAGSRKWGKRVGPDGFPDAFGCSRKAWGSLWSRPGASPDTSCSLCKNIVLEGFRIRWN